MPISLASHRTNNFDALRLAASVDVVVTHAWPLTGRGSGPHFGGVLLSHIAVYIFFSISGYLIATSWNASSSVRGFAARRLARIFPALVVVVLTTTFLIGPLVTAGSSTAYFGSAETWAYLWGLLLAPTYLLPGVFRGNPTAAVNGSLWSLGPEFICYIVVASIGLATWRVTKGRPTIRMAIYAVLGIGLAAMSGLTPDRAIRDGATAMVFFMAGAILAQRPVRLPLWPVIPLVSAWGVVGAIWNDAGLILAWLALPYAALAIGLRSTPGVRRTGRFGDFSYGIYLWGFVVQQLVWLVVPGLPLVLDIVVVLIATAMLAVASWYLIERRAIALARKRRASAPAEDAPAQAPGRVSAAR